MSLPNSRLPNKEHSLRVHILMCVARNLDLVVDSDDGGLMNKVREPRLRSRGVPGRVCGALIGHGCDVGAVGEETVAGIAIVGVEGFLIYTAQ